MVLEQLSRLLENKFCCICSLSAWCSWSFLKLIPFNRLIFKNKAFQTNWMAYVRVSLAVLPWRSESDYMQTFMTQGSLNKVFWLCLPPLRLFISSSHGHFILSLSCRVLSRIYILPHISSWSWQIFCPSLAEKNNQPLWPSSLIHSLHFLSVMWGNVCFGYYLNSSPVTLRRKRIENQREWKGLWIPILFISTTNPVNSHLLSHGLRCVTWVRLSYIWRKQLISS